MARAALNWSHGDLARAAGVHRNTISNLESGKFVADRRSIAAIRRVLESAGIEFIAENGGGAGVRLRRRMSASLAAEDFESERRE
jgi:transcriptional regulator with XRE-family HTH domain